MTSLLNSGRIGLVMALAAALCGTGSISVRSDGPLADWRTLFEDGTPHLHLRYRYEYVDQAGLSRNAHAPIRFAPALALQRAR